MSADPWPIIHAAAAAQRRHRDWRQPLLTDPRDLQALENLLQEHGGRLPLDDSYPIAIERRQ